MPNSRNAGRAARAAVVALLALGAAAPATLAQAPNGLALSGQWFRFIMASLPAAGYFTLTNRGATPATLTAASSPACGMLMLHESLDKNGTERMRMVANAAVPARGALAFRPGGYHLMCMQPKGAMRPGRTVPVTLDFAGGGHLTASFPVRNATGR